MIANPSKLANPAHARAQLNDAFREQGWAEPLWLETTVDDPGVGQSHRALEAGADLVLPLGGDGTVRATATVLRGTGTPMALLPSGTGNLLARNLGVPLRRRHGNQVRHAIGGTDRRIDVGVLEVLDGEQPGEHIFLVMCGIGLDADMLAGTPEALKSRIGWPAYVVSGTRHITAAPVETTVVADGRDLGTRPTTTVLIGSCGRLTGGVRLMPQATFDDGVLDAVWMSAGTIPEWARLVGEVLFARDGRQVSRLPAKTFEVTAASPRTVEVDGDILGSASRVRVSVQKQALTVRVP
ncbi:diacylglycerol/lipid kinase family protein [Dermacoccaceae bacterium W4C1]